VERQEKERGKEKKRGRELERRLERADRVCSAGGRRL